MDRTNDREPNRREFLKAAAGTTAGAVLSPRVVEAATSRKSRRKPNIVYVFSDEHRWQSMSLSEMPGMRTPNMAKLASRGMSFVNAISNYPVCSPHRAILMTGRWPYQQGVIDNKIRLRSTETTLGKVFRSTGYATGYIGKWHLGGMRAEAFGFDHSLIWSGTNNHWRSRYHPKDRDVVKARGYNATLMTDQALGFISRNKDRPFCLVLSLNPPHSKFTDAPKPKQALYPSGSLPWRPNDMPIKKRGKKSPRSGAFRKDWAIYQGYHAHISAVDDELGRIMAKLDELGIADDTILVYSSDHGSMLGSHGVGSKRQPFEESIRVPFIIRWPRHVPAGARPENLFGSIDIMPSICGLAGVGVPGSCVGDDFSPMMCGRKGPDPESQFIMHIAKENASGGVHHPAPLFRGVRTGRYTYAAYPDKPWCLFDNREDPYQLANLMSDPGRSKVRKELRAMVAEWLKKSEDPFTLPV